MALVRLHLAHGKSDTLPPTQLVCKEEQVYPRRERKAWVKKNIEM